MDRNPQGQNFRSTVLQVAARISGGDEENQADTELLDTSSSRASILELLSCKEFSIEFTEALFRFGSTSASKQVTTVDKLQRVIGRGEHSNEIISHLWAALFVSKDGKPVLEEFLERHVSFVFMYLESLVSALGSVEVPADILGPWLCSVRKKMGNDLAADQLYRIVDSVIQRNSEVAIQILEGIQVDDEIGTRDMHSAFLGKLRATQRKGELGDLADRVAAIDTLSRQSKDRETSIAYITSWCETAWGGQITLEDCRLLFEAYGETSVEFRETVIWTYSRILRADTIDESIIAFLIDSLSRSSSSDATDVEKQAIIEASTHLLKQEKFNGDDWLIGILPIQSEAEWAWMQIEDYLVNRACIDGDRFGRLFIQIAEKSGKEWLAYIDGRLEKSLLHMKGPKGSLSLLAAELLVNRTRTVRRVGFTLFEGISELLPFSTVDSWGESDFSLALMEARREYMQGAMGARYYVSLAQGIENRSPHHQEVLREEMEYFATNHGKSCRDYFEEKKSDFKILETVMANVDEQYEELKAGVSSPARQMQVPGFRTAELLHLRKFGQGVAEGVKKNSLVEFLCGRPHMLTYGRSFRVYQSGELGEASALRHSSTSIEIPIGEFTDPEFAALRRIQASAEINLICREEADSE